MEAVKQDIWDRNGCTKEEWEKLTRGNSDTLKPPKLRSQRDEVTDILRTVGRRSRSEDFMRQLHIEAEQRVELCSVYEKCLTGELSKSLGLTLLLEKMNAFGSEKTYLWYKENRKKDEEEHTSNMHCIQLYEHYDEYKEKIEALPDTTETAATATTQTTVKAGTVPKIIAGMQDSLVIGRDPIGGKWPVISANTKPLAAIFAWAGKSRAVKRFTNDMIQKNFCFSDGKPFDNPKSITNARNNYLYPKK